MSRPTALPVVQVEIAGSELDRTTRAALSEIRIQQCLSQPTQCELLFLGFSTDAPIASLGDDLKVRTLQDTLFGGDVTAVEYSYGTSNSRDLRIRCYDRLQRLRKRQQVRSYVEARLDDLIRDLTAADGISVQCSADMPVLRHLVQWRRSDFELLSDLTARFGLYFWLDGSILRISRLASELPAAPLELGRNLLRAHFEVNGDETCFSVRALGWDPALSATRLGEAHNQNQRSLDAQALHADATRFVVNRTADDLTQAQFIAQGELDRRVGREVVFSGLADGDAQLRPGAKVKVTGVATALFGTYSLTSVTHRIEPRAGHVSELSTEPPVEPAQGASGASVSMGIVTQVQDPERRGRVRVKLVGYNEAESGWLPVVLPGIGEKKGFIAVPNVGDTVLLLQPGGDPSHSIVIGGLYGTGGSAADMGVQDDRVTRFFIRTAAPHTLSFDDLTRTIRLEDSSTNSLELSPDGVVLHAANNMRIEAPGKTLKIIADKIDFERR